MKSEKEIRQRLRREEKGEKMDGNWVFKDKFAIKLLKWILDES